MKVNQYLHDSCICIIDQARGQDGWILAKFFFAFYQEKVKVNKNTKKKTPDIQPSSPVLVQGANQSGYRIHFILPPRRFSHDVLHTEVQYHSNISWKSLKPRSSRFDSQFSKLLRIEFQILSRDILWTCHLHILKIMYRSVRLVCFPLNKARTLKAKNVHFWSSVKSPLETCFLEVKANMYVRYCNSSENSAFVSKYT